MARTNKPDEVYHIPTLNVWFSISALFLLLSSVGIIIMDYTRTWKVTQREFRDLERERLILENKKLAESEPKKEIAKLKQDIKDQQAIFLAQKDIIDKKKSYIQSLKENKYYVAKQNYQFAKANIADLRFQLQELIKHYGKDSDEYKTYFQTYQCELFRVEGGKKPHACKPQESSLKKLFLDSEDELLKAEEDYKKSIQKKQDLESKLTKITEKTKKIEQKLDTISHGFFNDIFRDAPVLDFLVPSLKIKQIVIEDIRDNYNFATVQKEDRCITCHLGIDSPHWETHPKTGRFIQENTLRTLESDIWNSLNSYIDEVVPANEKQDMKDEFNTFIEDPSISLEKWLSDNFEDESHIQKFMEYASTDLENLRVRTKTFKAHPNLELYMSSSSPHSKDEFGCSVCHEGKGFSTDFNRSFHTPNNKKQEKEWKEKYGWHVPHYWDKPQLPKDYLTASCSKCHDSEPRVEGASYLNKGKKIVERMGCMGCHRIEGMTKKLRKVGPSLKRIAKKINPDFAYSWIWNPQHFRPNARMPQFFNQSNNSNPNNLARTQQELRGIVAYLFSQKESQSFEMSSPPNKNANIEKGQKLFEDIGCLGCHSLSSKGQLVNNHGPDLDGTGNKLSKKWLFNWLKNPRDYFPETHMPSLRLTDKESIDITAYLLSLRKDFKPIPTPDRNVELQKVLLKEAFSTSLRRNEVDTLLKSLTDDKQEILLGEKSIAKYGCFACHEIEKFEKTGPIGTELSIWGDKFLTQLDFGTLLYHGEDREVDNTLIDWATNKLKNPRVWDRNKETTKDFKDLLKMPKFNLTEDEIHAVVTFLISRQEQYIGHKKRPKQSKEYLAIQEGRHLARQYNCQGCHYFDGYGGDFAKYWEIDSSGNSQFTTKNANFDPLDYLEDISGSVRGHVPPLLLDQGNKTKPEWLFSFLLNPTRLRPKLKMRMPTFQLNDDEANALVSMFAGLEGHGTGEQTSYKPDPHLAKLGEKLFKEGRCIRCHLFTDNEPKVIPQGVNAPNLKLAPYRLQHTWTPRWLKDPQSIMPGANMPNYFDFESNSTSLDPHSDILKGDLQKGIDALNDFLNTKTTVKTNNTKKKRRR